MFGQKKYSVANTNLLGFDDDNQLAFEDPDNTVRNTEALDNLLNMNDPIVPDTRLGFSATYTPAVAVLQAEKKLGANENYDEDDQEEQSTPFLDELLGSNNLVGSPRPSPSATLHHVPNSGFLTHSPKMNNRHVTLTSTGIMSRLGQIEESKTKELPQQQPLQTTLQAAQQLPQKELLKEPESVDLLGLDFPVTPEETKVAQLNMKVLPATLPKQGSLPFNFTQDYVPKNPPKEEASKLAVFASPLPAAGNGSAKKDMENPDTLKQSSTHAFMQTPQALKIEQKIQSESSGSNMMESSGSPAKIPPEMKPTPQKTSERGWFGMISLRKNKPEEDQFEKTVMKSQSIEEALSSKAVVKQKKAIEEKILKAQEEEAKVVRAEEEEVKEFHQNVWKMAQKRREEQEKSFLEKKRSFFNFGGSDAKSSEVQPTEEEEPKVKKFTKNIKRIKNIVFNQDKSRFALLWANSTETIELTEAVPESQTKQWESSPEAAEGFTVLETQSLQEVLDFRTVSLRDKYNLVLKKQKGSPPCMKVAHLSFLFKSSLFAIVFEDKPNECEFYDIDINSKYFAKHGFDEDDGEEQPKEQEEVLPANPQAPETDSRGEIVLNDRILNSCRRLTSVEVKSFLARSDISNYKKYSVIHQNKTDLTAGLFDPPSVLRPKHVKSFGDEILGLEVMSREFVLFMVGNKILIYKGVGAGGTILKMLPVAPWKVGQTLMGPHALYSHSMCEDFKEIRKFAVPAMERPNEPKSTKQAIKVYDFVAGENSITVKGLPWAVGHFKLDKSGMRLVVVNHDGMYIHVYATLPVDQTNVVTEPIQRFCRGSNPSKFYVPMQIFTVPPPQEEKTGGQPLTLAVLSSQQGTIHVFRLSSDEEIYYQLRLQKQNRLEDGVLNHNSWVWQNIIKPMMPDNIKLAGSVVRMHLYEISEPLRAPCSENLSDSQQVPTTGLSMSQYLLSSQKSQPGVKSQSLKSSNLNPATSQSALRGLPYFAFIQEQQMVGVLTESGWFMKFSLAMEDLFSIQSTYGREIKKQWKQEQRAAEKKNKEIAAEGELQLIRPEPQQQPEVEASQDIEFDSEVAKEIITSQKQFLQGELRLKENIIGSIL